MMRTCNRIGFRGGREVPLNDLRNGVGHLLYILNDEEICDASS